MLKKIYYLSTCDTCKKIIQLLDLKLKNFELQDIKQKNISEEELTKIKKQVGSYEAIFSKVARKYKELNLKDVNLTDEQMKQYILDDYTFLKRPVILYGNDIFIGNAKATIENAKNIIRG